TGRRFHGNAGLAWNHVNMQVENHLSACTFIKLLDGDSIGRKCLHRRLCYLLRGDDHMCELVGSDIKDVARGNFWQHQGVALRPGHDVEERKDLVVLVDLVARQLAAQDFGKNIIWVVACHRPHSCSTKSLRNGVAAASSSAVACT